MLYYEFYRNVRVYTKRLCDAEDAISIPDELPDKIYENEDDAMKALAECGETVIKYDSYSRRYEVIYAAVIECEGEKNENGTYENTGCSVDISTTQFRFYVKNEDGEVIKTFDSYDAARIYARNVDGDVDYTC